jgi:hypothetical protein
MVGNREELQEKTIKENQQEIDKDIAPTTRLAREAKRGKRHNGLQADLGASDDEPRYDTPTRRHHPKFNSWCPADRDRLRNQS